MDNLEDFLRMVGNESIPEDLEKDYYKWVCEPIIKYPLAPRWARAVLEIVGFLLSHGVSIKKILMDLAVVYTGVDITKLADEFEKVADQAKNMGMTVEETERIIEILTDRRNASNELISALSKAMRKVNEDT